MRCVEEQAAIERDVDRIHNRCQEHTPGEAQLKSCETNNHRPKDSVKDIGRNWVQSKLAVLQNVTEGASRRILKLQMAVLGGS
jgi:hypothetical protein